MKNLYINKVTEVLELGVLDCFLHRLDANVGQTIEVVLEAMLHLLQRGDSKAQQNGTENEPLILLNNKGGLNKLINLQKAYQNTGIESRASTIINTYFLSC